MVPAAVQNRSPALADIIGATTCAHGRDDLLEVDALEVDACRAEVGVPELEVVGG
jgi:hypothetical protein